VVYHLAKALRTLLAPRSNSTNASHLVASHPHHTNKKDSNKSHCLFYGAGGGICLARSRLTGTTAFLFVSFRLLQRKDLRPQLTRAEPTKVGSHPHHTHKKTLFRV